MTTAGSVRNGSNRPSMTATARPTTIPTTTTEHSHPPRLAGREGNGRNAITEQLNKGTTEQ
ncbi:hypothetical protein ADEPHAGIA_64 [Mycobacterium phage Adephagia]|uniref:Uncharacterized protein n=1 Tax=Mycobacterium phage Adephagia TaxID=1034127 RepID=G1BPR8_9CAUD|nr:hypothetical protein I5G89_gp36 [Mycobacterium phage Adephagia]AEJ95833.1 hypothetical protein ADEPHAGIA_64 [Mycobacterium phage Adephagia]